MMHRALDELPVNVLLLGKGNTVSDEALRRAGARRAPAASSCTRTGARRRPRSTPACVLPSAAACRSAMHTDTLNEAGYLESTVAAIAGRSIHAYHTEGAGGGHAPDIIAHRRRTPTCSRPRPTRPARTPSTRVAEHLDMLMVCHHLNPRVARGPRVRREPDPRHDDRGRGRAARPRRDLDHRLGLAGDGPGRRDDHPHLADRPRDEGAARAAAGDGRPTTCAPRRYVAKYTICPAVAHGIDAEVGSVEVGKLADLVLWDPALLRRSARTS